MLGTALCTCHKQCDLAYSWKIIILYLHSSTRSDLFPYCLTAGAMETIWIQLMTLTQYMILKKCESGVWRI